MPFIIIIPATSPTQPDEYTPHQYWSANFIVLLNKSIKQRGPIQEPKRVYLSSPADLARDQPGSKPLFLILVQGGTCASQTLNLNKEWAMTYHSGLLYP